MTMPAANCDTCKFFQSDNDGTDDGTCHRYPPYSLDSIENYGTTIWPVVATWDWCGEHAYPLGVVASWTEPLR